MTTSAGPDTPLSGESGQAASPVEEGVANLPLSRGRSFRCLDDYLAHLEAGGAIDLPWWRQVRPGVYEYVTRRTGAQPETATRQELMQRFGFSC
jgi:hypothetical protein